MRPSRLLALVVAVAVLAVSSALPVLGQTDSGDFSGNELADGSWTGTFAASGVDTRTEAGASLTVTIDDSGTFNLTVTGGSSTGTWSSSGTNYWETAAGQNATITGTSNLSSSGALAGDSTSLTATGSTSQSGTLEIESGGQTVTRPISSNTPLTFSMTVTSASCDAAQGTLSGAFVTGRFSAVNAGSLGSGATAASQVQGLTEFFERFDSFMDRNGYSENSGFVEGPSNRDVLPIGEFMDLMAEAEAVLNELRNASACTTLQVGADRLEEWDNVITHNLAGLLVLASNRFVLSANDVRALTNAALRMGAIGSGARNRTAAAVGEEAMRGWMEVIVNGYVAPGEDCSTGNVCLLDPAGSGDLYTAAVLGNQMGWTYNVKYPSGDIHSVPASSLFEQLPGSDE